jgi:hypothetical protein
MNIVPYSLHADRSQLSFKFESVGPKGIIKKFIFYRKINMINENTYNLSFGDWNEKSGNIDDQSVSNNNETERVLFTVALTALQFVTHNPDANILIVGSTSSRTRLYQMVIAQNRTEIHKHFEIQGLKNGYWEDFKTGINFEAFLVKGKQVKW